MVYIKPESGFCGKKDLLWPFATCFCIAMFLLHVHVILPACAESIKPSSMPINGEWQFFRINAQYRGTVKQSYTNLGCAVAWFKDLAPDQTQAIVHVCALHPEKKGQKFAFRLNIVLHREECRYLVLSEIYGSFISIEGERQNQLRQLLALWTYMRMFAKNNRLCPEFTACDTVVRLVENIRRRGKFHEVNCYWPGHKKFYGKFFFEQSVSGLELDKFRFKSGKLSVSLVKDTQESILRDFAHRHPFDVDVFR